MKKKYIQKLQNEHLRKIRTGFRRLLINKIADIRIQIHKEQRKLDLSNEREAKKYRKLEKEWWELELLKRNGTVKCPVCNSSDKNMTFSPTLKAWYCNECYQLNHHYYKNTKNKHLWP
ncbi:MAG: hypothetical protein GF311_08880 [Candidatus Lokiarchaeota archaeon]|nr:hypothetical protein [Candidatus Lokiarchaeota archaeon]